MSNCNGAPAGAESDAGFISRTQESRRMIARFFPVGIRDGGAADAKRGMTAEKEEEEEGTGAVVYLSSARAHRS